MPKRQTPASFPSVVSRRALVQGGVGAVGLAALGTAPALGVPPRRTSAVPRIAVIGAGLAGLTCAYELTKQGVPCTLYEANSDRLGGRCWTSRGWAGREGAVEAVMRASHFSK